MVFIVDAGSEYNAPIEKIWKLNQAHATDSEKIHPKTKNNKMELVNDTTAIASWDDVSQSPPTRIKMKFTNFAPLGMVAEALEGPMKGSKFFNYYTPNGNKTGVTVVGDFKSTVIPESQLKGAVLAFLEQAYNDDSAYLAKMPT